MALEWRGGRGGGAKGGGEVVGRGEPACGFGGGGEGNFGGVVPGVWEFLGGGGVLGWGVPRTGHRGRSQPVFGGFACAVGAGDRASASESGGNVSLLWVAASHADGSRLAVVVDHQRMGADIFVDPLDRARHYAAVWTCSASADTRKSGTAEWHGEKRAALSRCAALSARVSGGFGEDARDV